MTASALKIPEVNLNDGNHLPLLGLGTWPLNDDEAARAVEVAIGTGYRLIDTAAKYENEVGVGRGLAASGVDRAELRVTTKLRGSEQGYASTRDALGRSLERLGLDYVDLYLIHWPLPRLEQYVDSYRAMVELKDEGLIRSVGVSNFKPHHLDRVIDATGVVPTVNQIQLSPLTPRLETRAYHDKHDIRTQGWRPLGRGLLEQPLVVELADKHGRLPAQILVRWAVQQDIVTIPKSGDPDRQRSNASVFDFELDAEDMDKLAALDQGEAAAGDSDAHEEF